MRFCILVAAIIIADVMKPHYIITLSQFTLGVLFLIVVLALVADICEYRAQDWLAK